LRKEFFATGESQVKAAFVFCIFVSLGSASPMQAAYTYASRTADGGCAITFYGDIVESDAFVFDALATAFCEKGKVGGVLFRSGGGSLRAGLVIGEKIRQLGLETAVSYDTVCASACALAWLAGKKRNMFVSSAIGFHTSYYMEDGQLMRSELGNEEIKKYLSKLGLPSVVFSYATQAGPNDMNWIKYWKAEQIGIPVYVLGDEDRAWIDQLDQGTPHKEE
jgi:ATP-dependent protease ClpP protease subunit